MRKRWALVPLLLAGGWEMVNVSHRPAEPVLVSLPASIDLGECDSDAVVSFSARIENRSAAAIELLPPVGQCGCVHLRLGASTIDAHGTTQLEGEMRVGVESKALRVVRLLEPGGRELLSIPVYAHVSPGLLIVPSVLHAGWTWPGLPSRTQTLRLGVPRDRDAVVDEAGAKLTTEFEGDFDAKVEWRSDGADAYRLDVTPRWRDDTLFGCLEGELIVKRDAPHPMRAVAKILIERIPHEKAWPTARVTVPDDGRFVELVFDGVRVRNAELHVPDERLSVEWRQDGDVARLRVRAEPGHLDEFLPCGLELPADGVRLMVRIAPGSGSSSAANDPGSR